MAKGIAAWITLLIGLPCFVLAQEGEPTEESVPDIVILRAEESYAFLDSAAKGTVFLQPLKWIPISRDKSISLTLGGEYRARMEHFTNKDYTEQDLTYYSQRVSFHASFQLGKQFRLFGELYSGYVTNADPIFLESDGIDLHQGFIEWKPANKPDFQAIIRLGRQEIGYGASRLVGIREGPNMRRSFDMARVIFRRKGASLDVLYGKEVDINLYAFDNPSNIFNANAINPSIWGLYYRQPIFKNVGKLDLYYFGFYTNRSRFNDVVGEERRHSIGIRSFGTKDRLTYNTEFIIQWGDHAGNNILAVNFEADWKFQLTKGGWKPAIGIRFDWSSGDAEAGDGKIGTFNPMFVNPAIYSLAAVNTPANIISLHPNLTFYPLPKLYVFLDYAFFYRTSAGDGLYTPPRFLVREAGNISSRHIGDVFGVQIQYAFNRNISFDLRSSYFIVGTFIEESGPSNNTFFIATTLSFMF